MSEAKWDKVGDNLDGAFSDSWTASDTLWLHYTSDFDKVKSAFVAYVTADTRKREDISRCLRETCALTDEELTEIFGESSSSGGAKGKDLRDFICHALKGGNNT